MMSKKMKGVALDPSPYGACEEEEDAKARFKHHTLIRDYKQLHKEAETLRNKLVMMKHKKLTLLAEVRYLKQRYKYLLKMKTINPPRGRDPIRSQNFETRSKTTAKEKIYKRKKTNLQNIPTLSDVNQSERISRAKESASQNPSPLAINQKDRNRIHSGTEATFRNTTTFFDLNTKERSYGGKELACQNLIPILDLKQKGRLYSGKDTAPQNPAPAFDLNQIERTYIERGDIMQSRPPYFDLNKISGEDGELQESYEALRIEEPKKFVMVRGENDEQHNDLKLSICRNAGNGPNRAGKKRKTSWQDPVALKVV